MYLCCYYCNFFSFSCSSFFIHLISIAMIIALRCWQSWWRWWYSKLFIFLFSFSILFFLSHPSPLSFPYSCLLSFSSFVCALSLHRFGVLDMILFLFKREKTKEFFTAIQNYYTDKSDISVFRVWNHVNKPARARLCESVECMWAIYRFGCMRFHVSNVFEVFLFCCCCS